MLILLWKGIVVGFIHLLFTYSWEYFETLENSGWKIWVKTSFHHLLKLGKNLWVVESWHCKAYSLKNQNDPNFLFENLTNSVDWFQGTLNFHQHYLHQPISIRDKNSVNRFLFIYSTRTKVISAVSVTIALDPNKHFET